jgi:hypothetical protein
MGGDNIDAIAGSLANSSLDNVLTKEHLAAVTRDVAQQLAHADYTKSISWFDQLPDTQKQAAMRGIAEEMAKSNPEELSKWLSSRSQDRNWKTGASVLINHLKFTDLEMAKEWEGSLRNFEANQKR